MARTQIKPEDYERLFNILHDHILVAGDEYSTTFLMDLMDSYRKGLSLDGYVWSDERIAALTIKPDEKAS